jgi:hypothetical protein
MIKVRQTKRKSLTMQKFPFLGSEKVGSVNETTPNRAVQQAA